MAAFERNLEVNLPALRAELLAGVYQLGGYVSFHIHDPKKRLISAALFRDRVVHHALINVIEPIFERKFIYDTYANRFTSNALMEIGKLLGGWMRSLPADAEIPGDAGRSLAGRLVEQQ